MLLAALLLLQTTPVAPIVRGTALPPPASEEAAVMVPITALLAALEASDGAGIRAVTLPDGSATGTIGLPDGTRRYNTVRWAEFAANLKPGGGRIVERLGTPAIEIDEDIAMVWAPYTVTVGGRFSHCGYDHVDLVRIAGQWKILNLTSSQRMTGCSD